MILTYKVKHQHDFREELKKARRIAEIAVDAQPELLTTSAVKHVGLKSAIANQILRKYGRNKNIKKVHSVKLTIPNQSVQLDKKKRHIRIVPLRIVFMYHEEQLPDDFKKINQIEIDNEYFYVSVNVEEKELIESDRYIGVDLNATGHIAVAANPNTGKVLKLGKRASHVHIKYKEMRRQYQRKGNYKKLKQVKKRESNIVRDLNHKISRKLVDTAYENRCGIRLEDLSGIRNTAKTRKSFRYSLHSWSFYQLQQFIEYKAKLLGVEVEYVNPAYTSKTCSRCGSIGNRDGKEFECPECGHVDHADANAAFNIAEPSESIGRLQTDRDVCNGSTDTPESAMVIECHQH